jgi:hypothetical protein
VEFVDEGANLMDQPIQVMSKILISSAVSSA